MNLENTKKQMRKGVLELCILATIADEEAYSTDIIKKLGEAKLIVKEGTIYPLLSRLKTAGLLHYNWRESENSPPRKYYYVTDKGKNFLDELWNSWSSLVDAVNTTTKNFQQQLTDESTTPLTEFEES